MARRIERKPCSRSPTRLFLHCPCLPRLCGSGEPGDGFPDVMSEANYCYRVGVAGMCSAVMRVAAGCEGVHACNRLLFRHTGDERSHGYGKGREPEVRWLLEGSNRCGIG